MITSITRFATDRGITVAVAKEQIAKHRIKHVRLSQAGYPLYSEQALIDACEELGGQERRMVLTLSYDDYRRLQRLARGQGKHTGSYAGWLMSQMIQKLYDRRYAD